ncbi:MAG: hypothetical protein GY862_01150 [Gammaproteobacteria bacterium]|nr:hypothetical protein [Gammaproteobacteria bacterium]
MSQPGEYARDEDGDGFHEVHVNAMGVVLAAASLPAAPHRGISQEKLPLYLGFFEFIHNTRQRGKDLSGSFMEFLLPPAPAVPQKPI